MSEEKKTETAITTIEPRREIRVVTDNSELSYLLDTAKFEHMWRIAGSMARASLIPDHLKGGSLEQTQANCYMIVNQSLRWGLDPFAVAPETYKVGGKLAYQGKLIAAVVNTRAGLSERLNYVFDGSGLDLTVTVSGKIRGEAVSRTVSLSVKQAKTANDMWVKNPEQKLIYSGSIMWARRHTPEVILGVFTKEELDEIDVTPQPEPLKPSGTEALAERVTNRRAKKTAVEVEETQVHGSSEPMTGNGVMLSDKEKLVLEIERLLRVNKLDVETYLRFMRGNFGVSSSITELEKITEVELRHTVDQWNSMLGGMKEMVETK